MRLLVTIGCYTRDYHTYIGIAKRETNVLAWYDESILCSSYTIVAIIGEDPNLCDTLFP